MVAYKLKIDLPVLIKGAIYHFDMETGFVYRKEVSLTTPLRQGLAGYLWLLIGDKRYMKLIK